MELYRIKNIFPNETPDISNKILFKDRKNCYKKIMNLEKQWGENYYMESIPLKIVSELDYDNKKLLWILIDLKNDFFKIYKNKACALKNKNDSNILFTCIIPLEINKKHLI